MKSSVDSLISMLAIVSAGLVFVATSTVQAGNLDFSSHWKVLQRIEMSRNQVQQAVMKCETVRAYVDMEGRASGATVVAGAHSTAVDKSYHIVVRLYKNMNHEKSCHVYIGKDNVFKSCNCEYSD